MFKNIFKRSIIINLTQKINDTKKNILNYNKNIAKFNFIDENKLTEIFENLILFDKKDFIAKSNIKIEDLNNMTDSIFENHSSIKHIDTFIKFFWVYNKYKNEYNKYFDDFFSERIKVLDLNQQLTILNCVNYNKRDLEYKQIYINFMNYLLMELKNKYDVLTLEMVYNIAYLYRQFYNVIKK